MKKSKMVKRFQRALARYALIFCAKLFACLPYRFVEPVARLLISIAYGFLRHQRRIAQESLTVAFGREKSNEEIQQIMKKCFVGFGQGMVELLYFMSHPNVFEKKITYEGLRYLDEALKQGNGVVALTAHFGNFPLMILGFAQRGYKVNTIIRPIRDEALNEFLFKEREKKGMATIYSSPRRACVAQSIKVLRNNEILFILGDQNFGNGQGVFVDFFGQKAATALGPVVFAQRTKAALIPMFIVRRSDGTHKVIIEKPVKLLEGEGAMVKNMAHITRIIEQYIRRYPHEWAWMHQRWKTRPEKKQEKCDGKAK